MLKDADPFDEYMPEEIMLANLYGSGGGNRYYIKGNGDICFSELHGVFDIDSAKELGFKVV